MPLQSLRARVAEARRTLEDAGVPSPEADAIALAAHALGVDAAEVRRRMVLGAATDAVVLKRYADLVAERAARIPLQHLTGQGHFRRLTLDVGPGVFLPRPETEVVAGLAIDAARRVLVAGRPRSSSTCAPGPGRSRSPSRTRCPMRTSPVSSCPSTPLPGPGAAASGSASPSTSSTGTPARALPGREGRADVVVANPPYIPLGALPVDVEVRDHDPELALYGGSEDGLAIPMAVAARGADLLRPGGVLVLEHADTQGPAMLAALARTGSWTELADHPDLTGRPRALVARRTGPRAVPDPGILLGP